MQTEIRVDSSGSYYEVAANELKPTQKKLEAAQISLNDCLACRCVPALVHTCFRSIFEYSGCITSAESVLISMQSHTEVLNFLANNPEDICLSHKVPVLSIAPQSLASLAASISSSSTSTPLSLRQVLRRVEAFCKTALGFAHVYDTTFARHISLLEHTREFMERKNTQGQLPMLASACPGWVCYAEKTHAEMLPFISRTKSPQQVMGSLVKEWMATKWGKRCVHATTTLIVLIFLCTAQVRYTTSPLCRATTRNSRRHDKTSSTMSTLPATSIA